MSKVLEAFGNVVSSFFQCGNHYFYAIMCFCLLVKMVFLFTTFRYFKSIKISDALRPEIVKINQKHKKNSQKATEEITQLLMKNGYSIFGGIGLFVLHALLVLGVAFVFKDAYVYLSYASSESLVYYGFDLTSSPLKMFFSSDVELSGIISLVIFLFAMGLEVYVDVLMDKSLITDQSFADKIMCVILAIGLLLAPSAAAVSWMMFKLFDLGTYVYVTKFYKATFIPATERNGKKNKKQ